MNEITTSLRRYGIYKLAEQLRVTPQAIYKWRRVPAEQVLHVERITGVPRHELRPDLYPLD